VAGGSNDGPAAKAYLQRCVEAAAGYPIEVRADVPLKELIDLYGESTLCWNATGYGEDADLHPDRFEHFGITTVEAMASGCVPLSLSRAGQPEIIEQGVSGVLWETLDELAAETRRLVASPGLVKEMADAAVERSQVFTYEQFRTGLLRLLADTELGRAGS
jgi:hypothetical protein